ncbi:MAG: fibronectin type III domain-containing protein, partial [Thermoplasmata archaeon]|nr:fibronectin type III domain-containing protein [Thermoplasmata archaeon]
MSRPIPPRRSTFVRRAPIRPLHGYVLPVLVLGTFLLPLAPFGLEHPVPVPSPHLPAPPRWTPEFRPASLPEYQVDGNLAGIGLSGAPGPALVGAEVDLLARPCEGFDACPFLESTLTQAPSGNFSLRTVPGDYFLITNRTSAFGGTEAVLNLTNSSGGEYGPVELRAEPFVPYANVSFQLPAWNNLSDTAANCNAMLPCQTGGPAPPYGTQQPILSWTSDGVFYVNLSDELVFYNFENRSVRAIADWLPLYDDLMAYQGIENTEFLTVDGSYVYEFGCAHVCTPASTVEFFAVNTTTGRSFSTTVNSTDAGDFQTNGQVDLIGENGNLSIAAFVQSDGVVLGFDLWNDSQWTLGVLPFFEANNLYWIPAWGSYLDVQSAQATPQHIDQIRLDGPAPGAALDVASNLTGSPYFPVNGVNGLVYNLSAQSFTFTSQYVAGTALTYRADLSEGGTLQSLRPIWGTTLSKFGIWPNTSAYPNVASSEHRPTMILSGPAFAGFGNGWFENRSAMVDPGTGVWVDTNVSFDHPTGGNKSFRQTGPSPASMEGLFYNTSYALLPGSYDCRTNGTSCPIRGNVAPSVSTGTVWWSWRAGLPEFPFPASAPIAEVAPPAAPTGLGLSFTLSHLDVRWNASTTPASELLGYQLTYGPTRGGPYRSAWVPANRTQTSLGPVSTGREYVVELFAWNLHGRSAGLVGTGPSSVPLGWLNLTVAPFDANVTLDQIPVSLTGGITALPLAFGSYWVNATAPGYTPLSEVVNISLTTGRSLDLDLVGILPELAGSIFPSTAHLYVDGAGVNLSANGSFQLLLSEGAHAISANAPGYFPILRWNLSLSFGEHLVEHVRLNRSYGWLVGTVSPPNASAVLSGVTVNLTGGHLL